MVSANNYDFIFLQETKSTVNKVASMFGHSGFRNFGGVNVEGRSGGLFVGWKNYCNFEVAFACKNFIILEFIECNKILWYLFLVYGEPAAAKRRSIWTSLGEWLAIKNKPFLLFGDINQVDFLDDKLGGRSGVIHGAEWYNKWKNMMNLIDVPFKGPRFTWTNKRDDEDRLFERLDKAYASYDWFNLYPNVGTKHYPIQFSDHAPIEVNFSLNKLRKKKPYEVESWNLEFDDCLQMIKQDWAQQINGSVTFRCLCANSIHCIRDFNGNWHYDEKTIGHVFEEYFINLFSTNTPDLPSDVFMESHAHLFNVPLPSLKEGDISRLEKHFSAQEFRSAVFQLGPLKSPGPDGIPAIFYQKCSFFVKKDVTDLVLMALNTGNIAREINRTFICLIPKVDGPESPDQFRPISLCNVLMKIITK
ncbi:hypothetical protein RND81_04G080700, partial [Saponaria officinalis]